MIRLENAAPGSLGSTIVAARCHRELTMPSIRLIAGPAMSRQRLKVAEGTRRKRAARL